MSALFYPSAKVKQFLKLPSPLKIADVFYGWPHSGRRANVLASDVNFPADRPTEAFCF
jgi:hypothetical protein